MKTLSLNNAKLANLLIVILVLSLVSFATQSGLTLKQIFSPVAKSPEPLKFPTVTLADFLAIKPTPDCIVIDLRDPSQFEAAHIPDAINIPGEEAAIADPILLKLRNAKYLVAYSVSLDLAMIQSENLEKYGITNVSLYAGGIQEWQRCHLPLVNSAIAISPKAER